MPLGSGVSNQYLVGAGIKPGTVRGATYELGYAAVLNVISVHDLHATLLDRFGIDHARITTKRKEA